MYEEEIEEMRKLTEIVRNGEDISREEADWIFQWVIPDSIANRFFGDESKIKALEMQKPLEIWFNTVYEAMCAGRKGIFSNTIPLYYSYPNLNEILKKCFVKLKPLERAVYVKINSAFRHSLCWETRLCFATIVDDNGNEKEGYAVRSRRACVTDRIGLNLRNFSPIFTGALAVDCDETRYLIEQKESNGRMIFIQQLNSGGIEELKALVIGAIMSQMKINHVFVNSFSPEYYYDETKRKLCWNNYYLYVSEKDLTKLRPYLEFDNKTFVDMVLSSEKISPFEKNRFISPHLQPNPTLEFIKTAAELLKEEVSMSELEKQIRKEKKTATDYDDWADVIR